MTTHAPAGAHWFRSSYSNDQGGNALRAPGWTDQGWPSATPRTRSRGSASSLPPPGSRSSMRSKSATPLPDDAWQEGSCGRLAGAFVASGDRQVPKVSSSSVESSMRVMPYAVNCSRVRCS